MSLITAFHPKLTEIRMADDTIGRWLLLIAVILFSLVAWQPGWCIRILSYGRYELRDINTSLVRFTRIVAAFSAVWGACYLILGIIRK